MWIHKNFKRECPFFDITMVSFSIVDDYIHFLLDSAFVARTCTWFAMQVHFSWLPAGRTYLYSTTVWPSRPRRWFGIAGSQIAATSLGTTTAGMDWEPCFFCWFAIWPFFPGNWRFKQFESKFRISINFFMPLFSCLPWVHLSRVPRTQLQRLMDVMAHQSCGDAPHQDEVRLRRAPGRMVIDVHFRRPLLSAPVELGGCVVEILNAYSLLGGRGRSAVYVGSLMLFRRILGFVTPTFGWMILKMVMASRCKRTIAFFLKRNWKTCHGEQNQTKYPAVGKVWHVAEQWSASFAPAPPLHPWEGLERAVSFPWLRMVVPWFPSSWSDQSKIDFNICNSAPFERWAPRLL